MVFAYGCPERLAPAELFHMFGWINDLCELSPVFRFSDRQRRLGIVDSPDAAGLGPVQDVHSFLMASPPDAPIPAQEVGQLGAGQGRTTRAKGRHADAWACSPKISSHGFND